MRHGDKINNLGRTASHRRALLANLGAQLIQHKRITTTLAKAKALRTYIEPLITKSKENTTHQRRIVFSYMQDKEAIKELFDVIRLKIEGRPGGYTRIIKLGARTGDNAELAMIELVDYNDIYGKGVEEQKDATAKRTRRAGRTKKAPTETIAAPATVPAEETAVDEASPVSESAPVAEAEIPATETPETKEVKAPE